MISIGDKIQAGVELPTLHGSELIPPIQKGEWFVVIDLFEDFFEIENIQTKDRYSFFTLEEIDDDFLTETEIRKLKLKEIDKDIDEH